MNIIVDKTKVPLPTFKGGGGSVATDLSVIENLEPGQSCIVDCRSGLAIRPSSIYARVKDMENRPTGSDPVWKRFKAYPLRLTGTTTKPTVEKTFSTSEDNWYRANGVRVWRTC